MRWWDERKWWDKLFNEIVKQNEFTPEAWKKVKIKVIHKKGDLEDVGNYRPICSLPALYKLFTTILHSRLNPRLDQTQAEDQGFRSSYQTTDHLSTYKMMDQKCNEWRINMWTATIDFTKAFDSITHKSIWNALKSCGIEHDYISLLKKPCRDQKASALTDEESDVRDQERNQTGWPSVKLALQHAWYYYRQHWKTTFRAGKSKKVWESTWVTTTMSASQTWDLLTTCSCLHPPKNSSKTCCANSRGVLKKWDSGSIQGRRKFLATKARTRNWGRWRRNTNKRRKHEILGPDDYFPATGDDRNRRSDNSDDMLRIRNMDTHTRVRKNDSINATQNASTHHTNEKNIQKDRETKRRDQRRKRH